MNNFVIFLSLYKEDTRLIKECISSIKKFYPNVKIFCITDGIDRDDVKDLFHFYIKGERIKLMRYGGLWTLRFLNYFYNNYQEQYLLKIDADTLFVNSFKKEFPSEGLFGNIENVKSKNDLCWKYLQGGCIGFERQSIKEIINSNLLLDNKYKKLEYAYRRYLGIHRRNYEKETQEILSVEDRILFEICDRLDITVTQRNDFQCFAYFDRNYIKINENTTVIHPNVI